MKLAIIQVLCVQALLAYSQIEGSEELTNPNVISKGYTDFSSDEIEDIVRRHNYYRANSKPSAANMRLISWDDKLATEAQDMADQCTYDVSRAWTIKRFFSRNGVQTTDYFHDDEEFFSFDSNSCIPGESCDSYKQVVWADSTFVGCGRRFCSEIEIDGDYRWTNVNTVVCSYGPTGPCNDLLPFIKGERCSQCPNDMPYCTADGLCHDCRNQGDEDDNCVCKRQCQNCGTLDTETCTCTCAPGSGFYGVSCSEPCANHDERCGVIFTQYACDREPFPASFVRPLCPITCGLCEPSSADFQCINNGTSEIKVLSAAETPRAVKSTKYCKTIFTSVAVINQQLYVFKKEKFWRFDAVQNGSLLTSTSGDDTKKHFRKVNPDVRAVYQRETDGKVLFFRGKSYWEYSEDVQDDRWLREEGFPKQIKAAFRGLPTSVSAAVYDRLTEKTYLFKGTYVWRYDERSQSFDMEKERLENIFNGVPPALSGAFQDANGDFIFVKGRDFWRVPYGENRVVSTEPENLALAFMNCYE